MAKENKDDDNFADEFEGDEFEDEGFSDADFDLNASQPETENKATKEPGMPRVNGRSASIFDKLLALKKQIIFAVIAVIGVIAFLIFNNNSSASKNMFETSKNLTAASLAPAHPAHVDAATVTTVTSTRQEKPELQPMQTQTTESIQHQLKQNLPKVEEPAKLATRPIPPMIIHTNNNQAVMVADLEQKITQITNNINNLTANVQQITALNEAMLSLKAALSEVNSTLAGMDNRILGLTETVDHLTSDVSSVKNVIKDEDLDLANALDISQPKAALSYTAPQYAVHAIIPGRAWLKTDAGQIITVTEGDDLGDYGKIAAIDANNSIVHTSSGVTLK